MDNLTHTLLGAALAKTRLGRLSPLAAPALLVAANIPDVDIVTRLWSKEAYLIHHRGLTHSVFGIVLQIPLLTVLFRFLEKRFYPAAPGGTWRGLTLAVAAGLFSHPLLDSLNTYGVRPWLPFDETWYYGDMAFIVDPWLWLLFGGAAALAGARSRAGHVAWAFIAAFVTYVIYATSRAPLFLQILWPAAVAALIWGRWKNFGLRRPQTVVGVAGGLTALYLGGLAWASHAAGAESRAAVAARLPSGETVLASTSSPQPADPFSWFVCLETPTTIYFQRIHLLHSAYEPKIIPRGLDDPRVQRAAQSPAARAWRVFARHPFAAAVERNGALRVYLMDARYQTSPGPSWSSVEVDLDKP